MQREEVVRIPVVEGTQSQANGVQRGGWQRRARHVPSRNLWPTNQTSDADHSQQGFPTGGRQLPTIVRGQLPPLVPVFTETAT
ncbi:hypothetical protein GCM10011576_62610 [Micromonospora parathelypteridis]|nr:hypothetical protein GCM10011576_62610 [Micromonospora parathelypteridis]